MILYIDLIWDLFGSLLGLSNAYGPPCINRILWDLHEMSLRWLCTWLCWRHIGSWHCVSSGFNSQAALSYILQLEWSQGPSALQQGYPWSRLKFWSHVASFLPWMTGCPSLATWSLVDSHFWPIFSACLCHCITDWYAPTESHKGNLTVKSLFCKCPLVPPAD